MNTTSMKSMNRVTGLNNSCSHNVNNMEILCILLCPGIKCDILTWATAHMNKIMAAFKHSCATFLMKGLDLNIWCTWLLNFEVAPTLISTQSLSIYQLQSHFPFLPGHTGFTTNSLPFLAWTLKILSRFLKLPLTSLIMCFLSLNICLISSSISRISVYISTNKTWLWQGQYGSITWQGK